MWDDEQTAPSCLSPSVSPLPQTGAYALCGLNQGCLFQMRVTHGRPWIAMPEQLLHFIQRMASIDEKTGKCMAEIVNAHPGQAQFPPNTIPEAVDIRERLVPFSAWKKPRGTITARNSANNARRFIRQEDMPWLPRLGERNDKQALL